MKSTTRSVARAMRAEAPPPTTASELTANVEKVMPYFVQGVHGHPAKRSLLARRVVVHRTSSVPVFGRQASKVVRVQIRGFGEFEHNVLGVCSA